MRRLVLTVTVACSFALLSAPAAFADPPGNNGTVKIDGVEFDTHPDNEPHVGCTFQVDFYGFDEGVGDATATFRLHPPTGNDLLLETTADNDGDPAGGGTDLDAEITVDLSVPIGSSGVAPHPIQGWHVKLTVNAPGSIGADVKHKVFWVSGCGYPAVDAQSQLASATGRAEFDDAGGPALIRLVALALILLASGLVATRRLLDRRAARVEG